MDRAGNRRLPLALAASLVLVAGVATVLYLPALTYGFLNWDDDQYVLNNPWIRSWSSGNLAHVLTTPYYANFLPLHLVSYMIDYAAWGLNPFGYHLHSVLLHALNAVLALLVVRRMFGGTVVPFLAALLFAVHPSHVEAVAWISIRKDLLATSFALLSVLFHLQATRGASLRWTPYAGSVLCFALGLLSKLSVVTLPLFLLLLDVLRPAGAARRAWNGILLEKAPHAAIGLWLLTLNFLPQTKAGASYAQHALSYAAVKGLAAWKYLGLLAGFLRGNPDYDLPALGKDPGTMLLCVLGLLILPLGAWVALRLRSRATALGLAWTFITLLPALAFPLVTYMADRYLYLPSLGFCWVLAAGITWVGGRAAPPRWRTAAITGLALIPIAGFSARTLQDLPVWRDSESLWSHVITRSGDFRAYTNLAEVRLRQGRWDDAERLLLIAVRIENATAYQNLAVLHFQRGRYAEARDANERALVILRRDGWDPVQASVLYHNLGAVYEKLGRPAKAVEALEASLRENPSNASARGQLDRLRGDVVHPEPRG